MGSIIRCFATGTVAGGSNSGDIGGLCGSNWNDIRECYATCVVSGRYGLGGLSGNNYGKIRDCYATGAINGCDDARVLGGLCGYNDDLNGGLILSCYATGPITWGARSETFGGLCGLNFEGTIQQCFWDTQSTGLTESSGGTGKTTSEMKYLITYLKEGWDFENVWRMPMNDYPRLGGEPVEPQYSGGTGTETDPYRITKAADWRVFMNDPRSWDKNFILVETIDFGGAELTPIGCYSFGTISIPFTGVIDGQGNTLRNATIQMPESDAVGLFGFLASPGLIRNLGIADFSVMGRYYVGSLCGTNGCGQEGGTISGCFASGTVSGMVNLGGLCGHNDSGTINHCYVT